MSDHPKDVMPRENAAETEAWAGFGQAWRGADPEILPPVDTAEIARRAGRFAWTIRLRNAREWLASAALVAIGACGIARGRSLLDDLPSLAMIAVAVWVSGAIFLRGRNLPPPSPAATTAVFLAYERRQLERQRALLATVRRWYLAPIAGAIAVTFVVSIVEIRAHGGDPRSPGVLGILALILLFQVAVLVGVDRLNARAARKLEERLAKLGDGGES